ncbi:uncharacterized protein LTR77_000852 [Saxophila tyrrhenica]|uniref:MATE efflux family protein n=1 Tax=Saxophila tyrrhenica TaxID=1690608 RepID=A0AAV9PR40_9PEZI|nr:hypothetical protein LTR77_000852 [Saxophila tyrrhenica]
MDPETEPLLASNHHSSHGPAKDIEKVTWRTETLLILRQTTPLIATYLLQYIFSLTAIIVCSRLSTTELAAASLGLTTSNIIGLAVWEGMATALDTLCAQAYGGGNPEMVGVHVLRFTILVHLVAVPIGGFWITSPWIMPYLTPDAELAEGASTFLQWYAVGIPGYAMFEAGKRFVQAQGNFTSGLGVLVVCVPVNIFLNWLLVFRLELRIVGAALAAALTNLIRPVLLAGDVVFIHRQTLKCWPSHLSWVLVFANWGPMVRLAVPGAAMTLSEWLAFEALTFVTSYAGVEQLAAQTYLATISVVVWHVHFSGSVVTSTRLGRLIGSGQLETAREVSWFYFCIFIGMAVFDVALFVVLIEVVLSHLTSNKLVEAALRGAIPFAIVFTFCDCMATCMHGTIRGLGWHHIGGWVTGIFNYLYAVPLALVLELGPPRMGKV